MSYDAVNQVTRVLRMLLHRQLIEVSQTAIVTLLPPGDQLPAASGVNLYLYRVMESPHTRNQPWRGDRDTPPSMKPALGLQLFYLLTPLGTQPVAEQFDQGDDAHLMLGVSMQTLFENPILNDVHFPDLDADLVLPPPLRDSYEQIKVTLMPSSLEELSKIWATINQPYRLSVAYEVSLVELSPSQPSTVGGGALASINLNVNAPGPPYLTGLVPQSGALATIGASGPQGNLLQILGSGLATPGGRPPVVMVGGKPVMLAITSPPSPPSDQSLMVILPRDLDGGPQVNVQVSVANQTSIPQTFTISPWLAQIAPIRTALDPTLGNAELMLSLTGVGFSATPPPRSARFEIAGAPAVTVAFPDGSDTQATVPIPMTLANGVYRVRFVRSDGGASNARMLEVVPLINRPIVLADVTSPPSNRMAKFTINGARLNGRNISLNVDGTIYQVAPDPTNPSQGQNPSQIVAEIGRLLAPGTHTISVNVDGHQSRAVTLEV